MATFIMTITGDQLGTFTGLNGTGNGAGRVVTLSGVQPYGTAAQIFTVHIDQAAPDATQFANGQWITILDGQGNVVMPTNIVQPDAEQGLGAGDEHLILQSSGFLIDVAGVTAGTMTYDASSQIASVAIGDNDGELDFADTRTSFPCFGQGTLIATPRGEIPAEDLAVGDWVTPLQGPPERLIWVGLREVRLSGLHDPRRPIRVGRGRLGHGLPDRDLLLSPQHRLLVRTGLLDPPEILIAARALVHLPGIRPAWGKGCITLISLMAGRHVILRANGAPAESFYPGPYIMGCLPPFQRLQVWAACPALRADPVGGYGPPARLRPTVAEARRVLGPQALSSLGEDMTT